MDILCGCLEYKTVLDVVVNAFYIRDGKSCLLSERNMYIGKYSFIEREYNNAKKICPN